MSETAPVARSPIAPPPPVVVEHGWEFSARRSGAGLRIIDLTPLTKLLVAAAPQGRVAAGLGVTFGRASRDLEGSLVVGSGPGEWLLLGAPGQALSLARSADAEVPDHDDDELVSTFDVTHGRAMMRVVGDAADAMLAKVCAVDLSDAVTPDGAAFRTSVAKLVTDVVRDDVDGQRSYVLHCERSSGQYLFDALVDAGAEYGIDIDGFVFPGI